LLASVGLQEFVAEDPESYVETAASLGDDLSRLTELRLGLRDRMRASPLCGGAGFARTKSRPIAACGKTGARNGCLTKNSGTVPLNADIVKDSIRLFFQPDNTRMELPPGSIRNSPRGEVWKHSGMIFDTRYALWPATAVLP
jgi:hypothetical protein